MKDKTTHDLIQRLKTIAIEKWNLDVESTMIIQELWERIPALTEEDKPKSLVKGVKYESKRNV